MCCSSWCDCTTSPRVLFTIVYVCRGSVITHLHKPWSFDSFQTHTRDDDDDEAEQDEQTFLLITVVFMLCRGLLCIYWWFIFVLTSVCVASRSTVNIYESITPLQCAVYFCSFSSFCISVCLIMMSCFYIEVTCWECYLINNKSLIMYIWVVCFSGYFLHLLMFSNEGGDFIKCLFTQTWSFWWY